jgi:Mg2+ and Co2+ transporter CorA
MELLTPVVRQALMGTIIYVPSQDRKDVKYLHRRVLELKLAQNLQKKLREMHETIKTHYGGPLGNEPHNLIRDSPYAVGLFESSHRRLREKLAYDARLASLEESRMGIQQNQSVKVLTQVAFVFIPLSIITSVFGMNVDVLTGSGASGGR